MILEGMISVSQSDEIGVSKVWPGDKIRETDV